MLRTGEGEDGAGVGAEGRGRKDDLALGPGRQETEHDNSVWCPMQGTHQWRWHQEHRAVTGTSLPRQGFWEVPALGCGRSSHCSGLRSTM